MTCKDCIYSPICKLYADFGVTDVPYDENDICKLFRSKIDLVGVVRCKDCKHATELDKHCEINRTAYKHCSLLRGEETKYVWHKYKKYYKDYSLVELDEFCSFGERRSDNE